LPRALRNSLTRKGERDEISPQVARNAIHRPCNEEHHETSDQTQTAQGQEGRPEDENENDEEAGEAAETRSAQGQVAAPSGLPKFSAALRPRASVRGRFLCRRCRG